MHAPADAAIPSSLPRRRAFLLAGVAFLVGSLAGGAGGYAVGVAPGEATSAPPLPAVPAAAGSPVAPPASGDAQLDELRRLAIAAPIDELLAQWNPWGAHFIRDYPTDPVLWQGLDRLLQWVQQNPQRTDQNMLLMLLAASQDDARPGSPLVAARDELRRLRAAGRR